MKLAPVFLLLATASLAFGQNLDTVSTPEPATLVLLGTGLAGIAYAGWRRKQKK